MEHDRRALNRLPHLLVAALAAPPALFVAVFYAWPAGTLVRAVAGVPRLPGIASVLWFTTWQAAISTAATLAAGLGPAWLLARYRFRGRRLLLAATTVPFMLPTVAVAAAFIALLPRSWVPGVAPMIAAHAFFNVAVVVQLVGSLATAIPHDLLGAARTLGAGPLAVARHVVLPLLRPALWAAATVTFVFCFTSFGVARLLAGPAHPTLEVEVARRATQLGDVGGAAVLSMLQLALLVVLVAITTRGQRRASVALRGAAGARAPRRVAERRVVRAGAIITALVMAAPVGALVARSLRVGERWSITAWRTLGHAELRPGISVGVDPLASLAASLRAAAVATAVSVIIGGLAAFAIAAARRRGALLDVAVMLPLGTSAVTVGFGMLITFDTSPFDWRGAWWLVPVGHALIAVPFVVRIVVPVLRAIPADRRNAAMVLGATPARAWWHVDVRAARRPLATAAGLAAAISLGEFGATTLLSRAGNDTLPIATGKLLGRVGAVPRAQGFAMATILFAVTAAVITVSGGHRQVGLDA